VTSHFVATVTKCRGFRMNMQCGHNCGGVLKDHYETEFMKFQLAILKGYIILFTYLRMHD